MPEDNENDKIAVVGPAGRVVITRKNLALYERRGYCKLVSAPVSENESTLFDPLDDNED